MTKDDKVFGIMTRLIFKVTLEKKAAKFREKISNLRGVADVSELTKVV